MARPIDVHFEIAVARAMLAELEAYLDSDVAYWQTRPNELGDQMPKLTIGGLLEAVLRAEAAGAIEVPGLRQTLLSLRAPRMERYLSHTEQEARSRLDAWNWYLDDYARRPEDVAAYYAHEVHARLKAELLLGELEPQSRGRAERVRAVSLDEQLRGGFLPGALIWDARLERLLPPERFWWLYGRLRR